MSQDSVMPNPKDDFFVILTSDTVLVQDNIKHWKSIDGEIFRFEAQTRQSAGSTENEVYVTDYRFRRGDGFVFLFDHYQPSPYKKVVLPKAFLRNVQLIDLEAKFSSVKNDDAAINRLLDTLSYGKDLGHVKKLCKAANPQDKLGLQLARELKPYEKRIWLIDRRYMTTDSVTLLEVSKPYRTYY